MSTVVAPSKKDLPGLGTQVFRGCVASNVELAAQRLADLRHIADLGLQVRELVAHRAVVSITNIKSRLLGSIGASSSTIR